MFFETSKKLADDTARQFQRAVGWSMTMIMFAASAMAVAALGQDLIPDGSRPLLYAGLAVTIAGIALALAGMTRKDTRQGWRITGLGAIIGLPTAAAMIYSLIA